MPARAPRRGRAWPPTCCASASQGLGPLRVDLIGVISVLGDDAGRWLAQTTPGEARDVRLRVALQPRRPRRCRAARARGDGAVHLRAGRRRRRAHQRCGRGSARVSCTVPRAARADRRTNLLR